MLPDGIVCLLLIYTLSFFTTTVLAQTPSNATTLPIGSCTATIPCSNGACCNGDSGFCGFGPDFCTPPGQGGPCTSNCDALAECGPFAAAENRTCPLNVCCSQFGFCGTTEEFCTPGCLSNCDPAPYGEDCGADQASATQRRIGYYEAWATTRTCDAYPPSLISAETLTHVNFAFALISSAFTVIEMSPNDNVLWSETTQLKSRNPSLKVFLSIGGWSFNDPPTQNIFSDLVGSDANTQTFIGSVLNVMEAYGFDGIDIDWEYPAAPDRGGVPADKENYPKFMAAVKSAFSARGYGLTFTAPSSYWYLQHFDLPSLLQSADWVNVMTYDLHGVWDGNDPWIGAVVLAHTNLTEIQDTMQLFANVGVATDQIVLGIGFYGRSFQLATAECTTPGCPFVGGADAGPCSANSGTLMFSEIETIIATNNLEPIVDDTAAVKYIVWDNDQWVSYDDAETFQMKMNYANNICLGGTMIWSVDQDDQQYTALTGLYPDIDVNQGSSVEEGNMCGITGCGQTCAAGWESISTVTTDPATGVTCPTKTPARVCCPAGNAPQNCTWRGGGGHTCNGQCDVGEILLALDPVGGDGKATCAQGEKALCCASGQQDPLDCFATGCGASLTDACVAGYTPQTIVKQGSQDNGGCEALNADLVVQNKQPCPEICPTNNKPVCCKENIGYTNCHWVGDPPNCDNAVCSPGQVVIFSDIQGDASQQCVGKGKQRYYCCDPPPGASFLPVPADWVFPTQSPVGGGYQVDQPATFTVDFDDDTGSEDPTSQGVGSSDESDDGMENDSAFGEVFISSPHAGSVSSLDIASDWVLVGCSKKSDQPQTVLAYCSKSMNNEDSGCGHVFIGTAVHTIVKLPSSCSAGPYARVASLDVHPNQTILPASHQTRLPANEKVFSLSFDFQFDAIPDENGPVLMRADVTDIPGYWDAMIDSPPDSGTTTTKRKRDFHQPPELEKRWFGPFDSWLQKLTTVRNGNSISRNFHWSDSYTIFHQEEQCPNLSASLDITVTGNAQASSEFGYYLEASIVPPAIQQAYVFLSAGASASASITLTGLAQARFDSERAELISFGFPGLYYPGLLTLGPSLHIYGQMTGQLSMSGQYTATIGYDFPSIDLSFGKQDSNSDEENNCCLVQSNSNHNGYDYSFNYNVNLEGDVTAHLVPSLQLGLSVLGGALLDAQVFVEADLNAGVSINGSVSQTQSPTFCVQPHYGVDLNAGLTGSVLFWRDNAIPITFASLNFPFGGECFSSAPPVGSSSESSKREVPDLYSGSGFRGEEFDIQHTYPQSAYSILEPKPSVSLPTIHNSVPWNATNALASKESPRLQLGKRGVPFLPGDLLCPAVGNDIVDTPTGSSDCICYDDADMAPTGQIQDVLARRVLVEDLDEPAPFIGRSSLINIEVTDNGTHSLIGAPHILLEKATMRTCNLAITIPDYSKTSIIAYYDLGNPGSLDPTMDSYNPTPLNLGLLDSGNAALTTPNGVIVYAREHVYEQTLSSLFVDYLSLFEDLWQTADGLLDPADGIDFCTWVNSNLFQTPSYLTANQNVFDGLSKCYPSASTRGRTGLTTRMAVLEQTCNELKNTALFDGERQLNQISNTVTTLRNDDVFDTYCQNKQVAVLRAAAGITSFLNQFPVRQEFLAANTCIRTVWTTWYNAYLNANADAPNRANFNVPDEYDNWIHDIVANVPGFLRTQIQHLITRFNNQQTTPVAVDLSFMILLDNFQIENRQNQPFVTGGVAFTQGQMVSQADLTAQILNRVQDINWLNRLPTH